MKTIILTKEKNETIAEVIEYENEEQKQYIFEHFLQEANIIYTTDIDGFCYLQHRKK